MPAGHQGPSHSMFTGGDVTIYGGTFSQYISADQREFNKLTEMTAPAAFYNSGVSSNLKCHPETQVAILNQLKNWILGQVEPNASILWFTGVPGSGKSCISKSIAEWCEREQLLLASFFFLRADSSRNSAERFISTLAYTISHTTPSSRPHIEHAIRADPNVFSKAMAIQMDDLIIDPLYGAKQMKLHSAEAPTIPYVLVIDGLDECANTSQQRDVVQLFADSCKKGLSWKVMITSRADPAIQKSLDHLYGLSTHLTLKNSNEDIRRFLEDKFAEIRATHFCRLSIPTNWPSIADIENLVSRSFGLFIYAATVIKYVSSSFDSPVNRLGSILAHDIRRGDFSNSQHPDQDIAAYVHILETSHNLGFWL